jgi:hypothetical protein
MSWLAYHFLIIIYWLQGEKNPRLKIMEKALEHAIRTGNKEMQYLCRLAILEVTAKEKNG